MFRTFNSVLRFRSFAVTRNVAAVSNAAIRSNGYKNWTGRSDAVVFSKHLVMSATLKDDPGNDVKLQMYALYKQAVIGPNYTPIPGAMDIVGKNKWSTWSNLGNMSKRDAMKEYISLVQKLVKEIGIN